MWMFCKKIFYSKIEKIHHGTLKVIYGIDDFYNKSQINPEFMWSFFKQRKLSYNLRKGPILNLLRTQSTYGTNAVHFRGSLVWNILSAKVKSSNSVFELKTKIKNLGNIDFGCLICR